ncbi:MAG: hypothetical protein ALECFALPRED_006834 [Alectoria fallacina]|uniref:DUF6594 domain-containing protein n=1 Tax=Alectoria fallacina TaxID=1903189 RepID=A0A8H3IQA4_9LECA|nr:MAG: hypothetical protein ALECFALPRED_006834 [Alectoria fallacina]
MPSLGGTRRRHSKHSSASSSHKKAPPSVISTVSSTSSNATITSRSIFPSSLRPSKRPDAKKEPVKQVQPYPDRSRSKDDANKENLDVFAFMEHEEDEDNGDAVEEKQHEDSHLEDEQLSSGESSNSSKSSKSSSARILAQPQRSPRYSDLEVRAIQDGVQRAWGRGSLHSDSGISVRSGSPDQGSPILQQKLPTVFDEPSIEQGPQDSYHMERYGFQLTPDPATDRNPAFGHKHWPSLETEHNQCPEAYYAPSPPMLAQAAHDAGVELSEMSPRLPLQLIRGTSHQDRPRPKASTTGYEFLASNIHSKDDALLKPIYRKFEMLNNRMLLFLQDEISEMEEQLKDLDDAIAHEEQSSVGRSASRRAEAKLPSQLQWHRMDLLGRSFAKVEQYNRALTSYSNLTKSLEPASHADITAYRSWITKHAPMVESESAFLNKGSDLLSVSSPSASRSDFRSGTALETPVIVVAFGLLSTIIVFKVVPQILARLVISVMVGVASLCTLSPEVMNKPGNMLGWGKSIAT